MAHPIDMTASNVVAHKGSPIFDCGGAQVKALWRQLAIVVTVSGDIDADNLERVSACVRRFARAGKPVVLDMSAVESLPVQAVRCLYELDEDCCAAGLEWALIAGPAVIAALPVGDGDAVFPTMHSVPDALHELADEIVMRRRLLMPLLGKTA